MAFTSPGKDIATLRNSTNGKFTFNWATTGPNKGNPIFNDSRENSVLIMFHSHKRDPNTGTGGFFWDKTGRRGTFLYKAKQDLLATGGTLQGHAEDGGQQLLSQQLIQTFHSTARSLRRGRWELDLSWSVPSGQYKQSFSY